MSDDTLLSDAQRAAIGGLLGAGVALAVCAHILPLNSGFLFWVGSLVAALGGAFVVSGVFSGPLGQRADARLLLGRPKRHAADLALPKPEALGGVGRGALERVQIPIMLGNLSKASDGCGLPDVSRASARVLDAGQDLLERLMDEPHQHINARQTFAFRIPAAVRAIQALRSHSDPQSQQGAIIEALQAVAAGADRDREKLMEGPDAYLQTAMASLNATLGAERVLARKGT